MVGFPGIHALVVRKLCWSNNNRNRLRNRFRHRLHMSILMRGIVVKGKTKKVAYPLLRVENETVEIERASGFPPRLLSPAGIEPFDLYIDGHLSSFETA